MRPACARPRWSASGGFVPQGASSGRAGRPNAARLRWRSPRAATGRCFHDHADRRPGASIRDDVPRFKAGDTVRVHFQVIEGQRRRVQVFEGIVIKRQGPGARGDVTVTTSFGVGVEQERTAPLAQDREDQYAAIGDIIAPSSTTCAGSPARRGAASARSSLALFSRPWRPTAVRPQAPRLRPPPRCPVRRGRGRGRPRQPGRAAT